ncbi:hypothetical protein B0H14DRAFT_3509412 [Mycena olivaceomarginata]|nr:hypothetical protein B0H14DRAFT_3509412 [Mycena olivaceomarginata]
MRQGWMPTSSLAVSSESRHGLLRARWAGISTASGEGPSRPPARLTSMHPGPGAVHRTPPPRRTPPYLTPALPPSPYPTERLNLPLLTRQPRSRTTAERRPCPAHTVDARRESIMLDQRFWARDRGPGGLRRTCVDTYTPPPPHLIYTPREDPAFEGAMYPCLLLPPSLLADRAWGVRRLSSLRKPPAGERGAARVDMDIAIDVGTDRDVEEIAMRERWDGIHTTRTTSLRAGRAQGGIQTYASEPYPDAPTLHSWYSTRQPTPSPLASPVPHLAVEGILLPAAAASRSTACFVLRKARKDCACLPLRFPPSMTPPPQEYVGLRDFYVRWMEGWGELYPRECALDGSGRGAGDVKASVAPGDNGQKPGGLRRTCTLLLRAQSGSVRWSSQRRNNGGLEE